MDSKNQLIKNKNQQINQDLRSKSIDELLYIYFNIEKYVFDMMKDEKEENLQLIEDLRNKVRELDQNKASYRTIINELNQYNPKINEKEKEIEDLLNKKDELNQKNTKKNLIENIKQKNNKNNKPKDQIIKDFFHKKITFEEYMDKFKEAAFKYYYYNLMAQQVDKI